MNTVNQPFFRNPEHKASARVREFMNPAVLDAGALRNMHPTYTHNPFAGLAALSRWFVYKSAKRVGRPFTPAHPFDGMATMLFAHALKRTFHASSDRMHVRSGVTWIHRWLHDGPTTWWGNDVPMGLVDNIITDHPDYNGVVPVVHGGQLGEWLHKSPEPCVPCDKGAPGAGIMGISPAMIRKARAADRQNPAGKHVQSLALAGAHIWVEHGDTVVDPVFGWLPGRFRYHGLPWYAPAYPPDMLMVRSREVRAFTLYMPDDYTTAVVVGCWKRALRTGCMDGGWADIFARSLGDLIQKPVPHEPPRHEWETAEPLLPMRSKR